MSLLTQKLLLMCVLLLVSANNVLGESENCFLTDHMTVNITNTLSGNLDLTIHCKSKEDDLGEHLLHHGESFTWRFCNRLIGSTLFYCSFRWNNELHWYNAYDEARDLYHCHPNKHCIYLVKQSGPCKMIDYDESHAFCYPWKQ
ncbi:hypothetical protein P8452_07766 [Trifolium repens]|jgi:hypothetical protein|nr:hypothetical protein QL285_050579 [Trifolium repens]WJX17908.1 hypothetical protein P8452_07766 [Trifolium repens]